MTPAFRLERLADSSGPVRLRLSGRLVLADATALWRQLDAALQPGRPHEIDLGAVEAADGACAALLVALEARARCAGDTLGFRAARPDVERLLGLYAVQGNPCKAPPVQRRMLEDIGVAVVELIAIAQGALAFVGSLARACMLAARAPSTVQWADLTRLLEKAGANSVPIVVVINLLVGLILGLQSAMQMERFGVGIYVADLVGKSVVRELGPLMTAIIVTGRSGAAYAAHLGTMTVSEEISALRAMGIDPLRYLVIPRAVTLALMLPLLVLVGNFVGLLGGLVVGVGYLDLTAVAYILRTQASLDLWDIGGGLIKAGVFGVAIALIACERGLSTRGGAEGVGASTTSAVVSSLFMLVCLDAFFTIIFSALRI